MAHRIQALARVTVGVLWFLLATPLVLFIWLPVAILAGIVDVAYEFILDTTLLDQDNALTEPLMWYKHNLLWLLVGDHTGEGFRPIPYY